MPSKQVRVMVWPLLLSHAATHLYVILHENKDAASSAKDIIAKMMMMMSLTPGCEKAKQHTLAVDLVAACYCLPLAVAYAILFSCF